MRFSLGDTDAGPRYVARTSDSEFRLVGSSETTLEDILVSKVNEIPLGAAVNVSRVRSPLRPKKIVAIGLNYLDHIREAGVDAPSEPLIFSKFPSAVIGDGETIQINPTLTTRVDWEVELAVVIGKSARFVTVSDALNHVFGYTVANDVSARDVQFADTQWIRGKNFDTFCPLGSEIVTADVIRDPQTLGLGTNVNGHPVQSSTTKLMLFSVAELISYCSAHFTLEPGDVVLTGTPWGCGEFMRPKRSLAPGDVVEVWIDEIGTLTNPVVDIGGGHSESK